MKRREDGSSDWPLSDGATGVPRCVPCGVQELKLAKGTGLGPCTGPSLPTSLQFNPYNLLVPTSTKADILGGKEASDERLAAFPVQADGV